MKRFQQSQAVKGSSGLLGVLGFSVLMIGVTQLSGAVEAPPSPSPGVSPVASASGVPGDAPVAQAATPSPTPVTPSDARRLLREFQTAQRNELHATEHRNRIERKELAASHKARLKEWERREEEARRQFFREHPKGADKRAYMIDRNRRREAFIKLLEDERNQRVHEQDARFNSLKQDQGIRLKEFKEALQRGERPSAGLWPSS